jgi:hypothetical protein
MPPRWLTWAIIAFWVGMTGWLTYQQYSLRQRAGEPPPFTIDLTDEVGANEIAWTVLTKGQKKGQAYSSVKFRRKDHTFALHSWVRANDVLLSKSLVKMISNYRVNQDGELQEIDVELVIELGGNQETLLGGAISGKVDNGIIKLEAWGIFQGKRTKLDLSTFGIPSEIKISRNILNPMHMLNKINGLREGQEWVIQLMEVKGFDSVSLPFLLAKVSSQTLSWHGRDILCFLIEYREQNRQRVHARTWVRQRDGLVLQQQAEYMGYELLIQREKDRKP